MPCSRTEPCHRYAGHGQTIQSASCFARMPYAACHAHEPSHVAGKLDMQTSCLVLVPDETCHAHEPCHFTLTSPVISRVRGTGGKRHVSCSYLMSHVTLTNQVMSQVCGTEADGRGLEFCVVFYQMGHWCLWCTVGVTME